jgi:general secretion pathway protein G
MKTKKSGFTLVEILIVVVILGILAAIVIPQFTEASTEAKFSSLCTDLQTLRSQIELYKVQHNDTPPSFANFTAQMTAQTDITGAVGTDYGPYMQKIALNQFNNLNTLDNDVNIGNDGGGWEYNETTGQINADDSYDNVLPAGPDHANL